MLLLLMDDDVTSLCTVLALPRATMLAIVSLNALVSDPVSVSATCTEVQEWQPYSHLNQGCTSSVDFENRTWPIAIVNTMSSH